MPSIKPSPYFRLATKEEKEEIEKREKEKVEEKKKKWEKWEKASPLKRIFMYHPDTPFLLRWLIIWPWNVGFISSIVCFFSFLILLIFLNEPMYSDGKLLTLTERVSFVGLIGMMIVFSFLFSYALSRLKKWIMTLYLIFSIFGFVIGLILTKSILAAVIGGGANLLFFVLPQVIVVLFYYDKFHGKI